MCEARVLFTTQQMVISRCRNRNFTDVEELHFDGRPRDVRVWDEEMLPGDVVKLSTDGLASLLAPLRACLPELAQMVEELRQAFNDSGGKGTITIPDVLAQCRVSLQTALKTLGADLTDSIRVALEALYTISKRTVKLFKDHTSVISALDTRETLPTDLVPVVVLDASGRVRHTYPLWKNCRGGLILLKEAPKRYNNLRIEVMDQGGGKDAWSRNGDQLLNEVVAKINTKPNEQWLVVHHKGKLPRQVRDMVTGDPGRISFVNWGAHQGTNSFADISNVILAGTLFLLEWQYEGLAHLCANLPMDVELPDILVRKIKSGEHMNLILQSLCRASVRKSIGDQCAPCNAYIIAAKKSGIRTLLPMVFPGCKLGTWRPVRRKLKGKVADAETYVRCFFAENPDGVLRLLNLRKALGMSDISNFNKTIRGGTVTSWRYWRRCRSKRS